jgi:hypothetical protein
MILCIIRVFYSTASQKWCISLHFHGKNALFNVERSIILRFQKREFINLSRMVYSYMFTSEECLFIYIYRKTSSNIFFYKEKNFRTVDS